MTSGEEKVVILVDGEVDWHYVRRLVVVARWEVPCASENLAQRNWVPRVCKLSPHVGLDETENNMSEGEQDTNSYEKHTKMT
jgi:hypothetical protein